MPAEDRSATRWTPHPDEARLVRKHASLARAIARFYYIPGGDRQDTEQEALIGLLVAVRDFNGHGTLEGFAKLVIHRWLQTAITIATAGQKNVLTDATRVLHDDNGDLNDVVEMIPGGRDPADIVEARHQLARLAVAIQALTPLERDRLLYIVNGGHYPQGAGRDKQLENAVDRARAKLKAAA